MLSCRLIGKVHLPQMLFNHLVSYTFSHPHRKHAWAVGEGALVLQELKVHFADVVLQAKGCGEIGLAVVSGTRQHGLQGRVFPFVLPKSIRLLEHLLAHRARKRSCNSQ